jgi:hypothetical protein
MFGFPIDVFGFGIECPVFGFGMDVFGFGIECPVFGFPIQYSRVPWIVRHPWVLFFLKLPSVIPG